MEHSAYLDMAAVEERHWWFTGRRKVLDVVISTLKLKPGTRILELGAGTGGNYEFLSRFGKVTSVEMSAVAREIFGARAAGADIRAGVLPHDLPLAEEKFDLVCMFDVLEHIEDDAATLRAVRGLLAPGGVAMITVPAYKALFGPHDEALHHKRRYEYAELRARLREAGLSVEKLSFINAALLPAAWAARWVDKALGRGKASGTSVPPAPVNALLGAVFGAEAWIVPRINLPCGLSLLALARTEN